MKRKLITAAAAVACVGVLGACTPGEVAQWQAWHAQDPAAAEAFAAQPAADPSTPAPAAPEAPSAEPASGVWDRIAACESGGNWSINTGNGYYGGLQMLGSTWRAYGGGEFARLPDQASRAQQITVAERIRGDVGFGAWPACARQLGLR
jgi:ferric-dicitrate binding protein FerR (iron transport regulator)